MRTLIVPCAGERKIWGEPLYLNYHPDSELLALKSIEGIFPEQYDCIFFTILKEDEDRFSAKRKILTANNERYNISFVVLDDHTSGPAETIYKTLKKANIEGEFAVRDSHANLKVSKQCKGNFVAGLDLTKYEGAIDDLRSKSFISINEQGQILDIVEKHFCSDVISAGFYGFKSSSDFISSYEHLCDPNYKIKNLYLSHVISYLIGYSQRVFHIEKIFSFEDWSSEQAWIKVQKQNSLCFIDIDSIVFDENIKNKLLKLSSYGIKFVGYSNKNLINNDYITNDCKISDIILNCPRTISKKVICSVDDLDELLLEI